MNDTVLGMLAEEMQRRYRHEGAQARLAAKASKTARAATAPRLRHRLGQTLVLAGARPQHIND